MLALAIAVAAGGYWATRAALARLDYLEARANALEYELLTTAQDAAAAEVVNEAYARIRAQHSSSWTEEQIKDRLLSEIDALTHERPHAPDPGRRIVDRPTLSEATLYVNDEGYREYRASFEMREVRFNDLMRFLRRIQESPQALRIEELSLVREPLKSQISRVEMKVTRTVVEGQGGEDAPPQVDLVRNAGFESWPDGDAAPLEWSVENASAARDVPKATEGRCALKLTADEAGARLFQTISIPAAGLYRLEMDIYAPQPFDVAVRSGRDGAVLAGPVEVEGSDQARRVAFNVSLEEPPAPFDALAPEVTLKEAGQILCIDNVSLTRVE